MDDRHDDERMRVALRPLSEDMDAAEWRGILARLRRVLVERVPGVPPACRLSGVAAHILPSPGAAEETAGPDEPAGPGFPKPRQKER